MATPPKTPTPPRRKAATPRKTARVATPRKPATAAPEGETTEAPASKRRAAAKTAATPRTRGPDKSPRARKPRAATAPKRATGSSKTATSPANFVADARDRMGDRNFFAALIGGAAAVSAAVVGVLYAMRDANPFLSGGAHQADGNDSSASFKAGIADEGTIPEKGKG